MKKHKTAANLSAEQRVDAGTTRKYDQRETDDRANYKAELHQLTEQCRTKIHQNIASNFMVVECNVAKEAHLTNTHTHKQLAHTHTHTYTHTHIHTYRQTESNVTMTT